MSLRARTFAAVRWTTLDAAGKALFNVASIAVLARLLEPADYGLMAVVAVVIGFVSMFADLGVNSAFVQRQAVTEAERSSLYWLNVTVSLALAAAVVLLSPLLGRLYGDPRLEPLIMLSASVLVLRALGLQLRLAAEKELRFARIVRLDLLAAAAAFVTAVLAASAGWGVYALVASSIAGAASATALYWLFAAAGWRPTLRLRRAEVMPFLGFGSAAVGNNVVNYVSRTVDVLVGGRLLGATALGFYSVPRTLVLEMGGMINAVITRVGFPLIAQLQTDVVRVRAVYLQTLNMTAATNAPLYIGIAFFAPDLVAVLLGPGWERSGTLLSILALWGGLRSTGNPVGSLLYGMGRAGLALKWNLALVILLPLAVVVGARGGPEGVAYALLLTQVALFVPAWGMLVRPLCEARLTEYSVAALKPFLLALLAVAPAFLVAGLLEDALARLIAGALVAVPLYLALSYLANRDWLMAMRELTGLGSRMAR